MGVTDWGGNWVLFWWAGPCSVSQFSCLVVCDSATPWTAARQASLSITNSQSLLKLMSIESVMPSIHLILCCFLLLLPSIFPSIRVFSNESILHIRWPKYWSFSFSISPSNKHSGQISFRSDWLDLLAVQGTLKSLLQHHSSKVSILQRSAFFMVQLSHPYMTTGKTLSLTRQNFVAKVMSLLFSMLSRFVIAFLPSVMPDIRIPEREERRLPRQCNSQKKGRLLLTRVRAPAAHPTQRYGVRECWAQAVTQFIRCA